MKKNKLVGVALTISLCMTCTNKSFAQQSISDIQGHWAEYSIINFIEQGYVGGYEDNTFKPNNKITRAEFIKIVNKMFEFTGVEDIKFNDVNPKNWFYEEVRIASYNGYISENKDGKFRPNDNITREEIATMIANIMNNRDPKIDKIKIFRDYRDISSWAIEALEAVVKQNIIGGYEDNTIRPKGEATRAEAVSILYKLNKELDIKIGGTALLESNNYTLKKYEPRQGTYIGSYVMQDPVVNYSMDQFEKITGKKHASYFFYLGYKKGDLVRYEKWMTEVVSRGGIPHVALEPNQGLNEVYEDTYLIELAKMFGRFKSPVYLRYASEMNGNWVAYHGNPKLYKEKWRIVHDVMEKYAPNVIMVWTPYEKPIGNILEYYPGDEYVDWVGINAYNVVYRNNDISKPVSDDPLEMIDFIYDKFSYKKPISISEYGATHDTTADDKDYTDHAIEKLERLYGNIWEKYPRIKSIYYFNVNNIEYAPEGRKINNYSLTENQRYLKAYIDIIKDEHFLSDIKPNAEGKINREVFTLNDEILQIKGQKYINLDNIASILSGNIIINKNSVIYKINGKEFIFNNIYKYNEITYVNIREVAKKMGYKVENRGSSDTVILKKI